MSDDEIVKAMEELNAITKKVLDAVFESSRKLDVLDQRIGNLISRVMELEYEVEKLKGVS